MIPTTTTLTGPPVFDGEQPPEDDDDDSLEDLDILLNQSRPRHVGEGLVSGIGYMVSGSIAAGGIVLLSPQVGAAAGRTKGGTMGAILGGLVGTIVGAGSAVSVGLGGTFSGMYQIMRGIGNTPASIVQPRRGKWWNRNEGQWILTHLKSDQEWSQGQPLYDDDILGDEALPKEVRQQKQEQDPAYQKAKQYGIKDVYLYDLMNLDPDVTTDEIKRRYEQMGKVFNPNRAGGNTQQANDKFRQIGNAYVILTNPQMREAYDKEGLEGVFGRSSSPQDGTSLPDDSLLGGGGKPMVHPLELYSTLYGSNKFGAYIGRLAAAAEASMGTQQQQRSSSSSSGKSISLVQARILQKRRVTRLALLLADRLKPWVVASTAADSKAMDQVQQEWAIQADDLCDSSYGVPLVHLLGSAYSLCALQFLGSTESGVGAPTVQKWAQRQKVSWMLSSAATAHTMETFAGNVHKVKLKHEASAKMKLATSKTEQESLTAELYRHIGRDVLTMMWDRTSMDVMNTIHEASQMVLFDQDLNKETRKARGEGLEVLGTIFQKAKNEQSDESQEQQKQYEQLAFYAVLDTIRKQELAHQRGRQSGRR